MRVVNVMRWVRHLSRLPKYENSGTIYIHWPYCSQLCTYCNFNKYVRSDVDHGKMAACLVRELTSLLRLSGLRTVTSVYFGGGTPSLARPSTVETVIKHIRDHAELEEGAEVTLEANPTSAETSKLRAFKLAGVTRLSVGLQALVDEDLRTMNRDHSVEEAMRCLSEAHKLFPGHTNVDVIFGRPSQTLSGWKAELKKFLEVCGSHVSLYQLTVELGTPLAKSVKKNEVTLPDSDTVADMYEEAVEVLKQAGLQRYEVSNFCTPGCESHHNLSYWKGRNYLGIGPGAHSRFCQPQSSACYVQSVNTPEPNAWMTKVNIKGHGLCKIKHMSKYERLEEVVATSMRTADGLTAEIWESFGVPIQLQEMFPLQSPRLAPLHHSGHLTVDNRGIRASRTGLNVLDSILPEVLAHMSDELHSRKLNV